MKTYHLRILYPSRNNNSNKQSYTETVNAHSVETSNNTIKFLDLNGDIIATTPANYTIIEYVETIKSDLDILEDILEDDVKNKKPAKPIMKNKKTTK